jgi:hypothetical protein
MFCVSGGSSDPPPAPPFFKGGEPYIPPLLVKQGGGRGEGHLYAKTRIHYFNFHYSIFNILHSLLRLFVGFAITALTAWMLTVNSAIRMAMIPATAKIHQLTGTR